ncbi:putative tRNA (cytidine(34)-2'-O)-methyltransferase [Neochlamydia sp. AcF65]|nr:tRNA (cytidine(34)-2'-O)-methyltransferase [Neochlamydia sp. AcF65]MBS4166114.1 putative tRNA (cytidine(34)-2'-O)-methyltransferase [Neochlamydia sp. AcF65]
MQPFYIFYPLYLYPVKVVLYQPCIPQNTGNIVRTCAVTGNDLVLIPPLGFSISDRWLKRSGLDYWEGVNVQLVENLEELLESSCHSFTFFSSKATRLHTEVNYQANDYLIFGSETAGLPPIFFQKWPERFVRIPMIEGVRCLNLATSVGIAVYEAWRQNHFKQAKDKKN